MDGINAFFLEGNIFFKLVALQVLVLCAVLFILKRFLERELLVSAIEALRGWSSDRDQVAAHIDILAAAQLPDGVESILRALIKEKCPEAEVDVVLNPAIWGGIVIRIEERVLDFSLLNRLKHLFGRGA